MYDVLITGGTVVDGTGAPGYLADVGIVDGRIAEVGRDLAREAAETLDATGLVVTPGFVDIHTHYDGQATWDDLLEPSSAHGVTTVVTGNCGVGFAPVRPGREGWLIQLMEGVEDIPGSALAEGITWGWESFPEYLDVLGSRRFAVDVGTQVAHGALRGYVMGERGARNEPATPEEVAELERLVSEAVQAGALGVSTSRTEGHRAADGEPVPGTYAGEDELWALARGLQAGGGGVFEVAPAGITMLDTGTPEPELGWMCAVAEQLDLPVTFATLQFEGQPDTWRRLLDTSRAALDRGVRLHPQVAARPFGMLVGLSGNHPFAKRPAYQRIAHLPLADRAEVMARPEVRAAILGDDDLPADPGHLFDSLPMFVQMVLDRLFVLGERPDYEPAPERSVAALAEGAGMTPLEMAYEQMIADGGRRFCLLPLFNYVDGDAEVIREMLTFDGSVNGLGDGGAHCGMICDASIPTSLLSHWVRDRNRGPRLDLEFVVRKQTSETAALYGLTDRGRIAVGLRADCNLIDPNRVRVHPPEMVDDLPAGGRRLVQGADGYVATLVSGVITRRHGVDTGARPGRLIRGN